MLSELTDPSAVQKAITEYDELGKDDFLRKYGYGSSTRYVLEANGREYDSEAIVGAAYGFQFPDRGPLRSNEFSGGEATLRPALERLGYKVRDRETTIFPEDSVSLEESLVEVCQLLLHRDKGNAEFSQGTLDVIVEDRIPAILKSLVGDRAQIRGRTGMGSPADVPWVGLFAPDRQASAQVGFYLVYLFAKDGSAAFLGLGHGTARVKGGMEVLQKRSIDLRRAAGAEPDLATSIDLRSENARPKRYEAATAYAIRYERELIPSDDVLVQDLERMLSLQAKAEASGLVWAPDNEPLHLLFKWNADLEPRTIDLHLEIASREGSVWWGRFSKSTSPSISQRKLIQLQEQISNKVPTYAYLYRRGSVWKTNIEEATVTPPEPADSRFPDYYKPSDCNFFVRLSGWKELPPDWIPKNLVLASHPDPDPERMAAALGNQTTPLFVFELGGPPITTGTDKDDIDIPNVSLADICADVDGKLRQAGLQYGIRHSDLIRTAIVSLATKRFLLLTGLSGSGKTRLAIAIGEWFGPDRLEVIAVRPDWNGPDALFGFENGLSPVIDGRHSWTTPRSLQFMLDAARDPQHPYLMLLDEMNLAHVERYFADVLSGMESGKEILPNVERRQSDWRISDPPQLAFPSNLFIVGTVNIDETTYMFSPKVLDRANTLEFRVQSEDLQPGVEPPAQVEQGDSTFIRRFLHSATTFSDEDWTGRSQLAEWLRELHRVLSRFDREFGHRLFFEALRFGALLADAGEDDPARALDLQVLQKVLPRFHGSIREISEPLNALGHWCWEGPGAGGSPTFDPLVQPTDGAKLPLSFDKVRRMTRRLRSNHFVGFAE